VYQALYRKWRPQTFDQVVGQSHVTDTLKNQVKAGRLSHSYIFIGTRGTGKTTCARILAKAVNCTSPVDGNPCGKCASCVGINEGTVLDVVELDAASNNGVDNVRALREEAVFSPASVKKRVYIIDEVHMLSTSAFNALLKILEEPPEHLMFILATTELQKVPATILSRCQRHSFHRIDTPQIAEYLEYIAKEEGFYLSHDAAELIARLAEGGVRDALSLLDQCSAHDKIDSETVYSVMGLAGKRRVTAMLGYILKHDTAQALTDFNSMWMDGRDGASFLKELSDLLRDVLMLKVAPKRGSLLLSGGYDLETLKAFSNQMETEELICAMETVQRYLDGLRDVKNPKTAVELCLISLCDSTLGESVNALRARVAKLEAQLATGMVSFQRPVENPAPVETEFELPPMPEEEDAPFVYEEEPPAAYEEPAVSEPVQEIVEEPVKTQSVSWAEICEKAAPGLSPNIRFSLSDETKMTGRMDGDVLNICAAPGFMYERLNKQDVLGKFAQAASALCGREIRVVLSEFKQGDGVQRSLDELKQFSEVSFI